VTGLAHYTSIRSLSWLAFLQAGAGEPNTRTQVLVGLTAAIRGRNEGAQIIIAIITCNLRVVLHSNAVFQIACHFQDMVNLQVNYVQ
jgi:hypothetical protein